MINQFFITFRCRLDEMKKKVEEKQGQQRIVKEARKASPRGLKAKLTKKGIVGDLILPFFTHVIIIIKFPVMPIKNVNVCVMIIGRNAFKSKMQIKTNHNNT